MILSPFLIDIFIIYVQNQKYFVMLSLYFCLSHTFVAHIIIMCLVPNKSIPRLKNSDKIWLFLSETIAKKAIASRLKHFFVLYKYFLYIN
ncbi:MAG: hypothetical protein DRR19_06650 [Candidatus Parabeggiatoa sp. nov. 1]|nr:MAG: hypothetical protein DRR19_06650 [Gammaproteobacteria bacterium]